MMKYDTNLKLQGIKILVENLGDIETEKFLSMIREDPFDYTLWQSDLWKEKSVEEVSTNAMEYIKKKKEGSSHNPA